MWANRHLAVVSSYGQDCVQPATAIWCSEYLKRRAHLVITMGDVSTVPTDMSGVAFHRMFGGFLYPTQACTWQPYPFYVLVAVIGEVAHITLTAYDRGFAPQPSTDWTYNPDVPLVSRL